MKWKNKNQAKEQLKYVLDDYIKGARLMQREFLLHGERDSDVVEFSDDENNNGEAYVCVGVCENYTTFSKTFSTNIQVSKWSLDNIIEILGETVHTIKFDCNGSDATREAYILYKGVAFFALWTPEDYAERLNRFNVVEGSEDA